MLALIWSACYSQGLKTLESNPFYWEYHGSPTLLLGATDDDNLFQWGKRGRASGYPGGLRG